ncbi:MAG TPA: hypothetical protein VM427_10860 [Patescibacteria group bacterium]|nr:hypothetical protein [Patescibacteria group bacterium]
MKVLRAAAAALLLVGAIGVAPVAAHDATCSDVAFLGVSVHGMHVVRDYVMGGGLTEWPPKGGVVGDAVAGSGASLPGGPGPGFHFPNGVAPGASFCTDSNSPGAHV